MGTEKSDEDDEQETEQPAAAKPNDSDEVAELRQQLQKANSEAAERRRKLKEYEDRDKSDLDKLKERAETAEKDALAGLRWKVALEKGLTVTQAKRLVGDTYEALTEDADELRADLGVDKPDDEAETADDDSDDESKDGVMPSPASRPREDLKSGSGATDAAEGDASTEDVKAIGARMFER